MIFQILTSITHLSPHDDDDVIAASISHKIVVLPYLVTPKRRKICKIILAQSSEYLIVGSLELDVTVVSLGPREMSWEKPPLDYFKCNMSTVWEAQTGNVGAAWIVRDSFGKALFHSRRSFVGIRSQVEAIMIGLVWTTEALNDIQVKRIIFETSSPQIQKNFSQASLPWVLHSLWRRFRRALDRLETYRVVRINDGCNTIAQNSALQVQWQQSYLARNGPEWLDARINMEASAVV